MRKLTNLLFGFLILMLPLSVWAGDGQFPEIVNLTLSSADTEFSTAITGVKKFTIQCRTASTVRFAYETGKVAIPTEPYLTIKAGAVFWEDDIILDKTLYFATDATGRVVEILLYR